MAITPVLLTEMGFETFEYNSFAGVSLMLKQIEKHWQIVMVWQIDLVKYCLQMLKS